MKQYIPTAVTVGLNCLLTEDGQEAPALGNKTINAN